MMKSSGPDPLETWKRSTSSWKRMPSYAKSDAEQNPFTEHEAIAMDVSIVDPETIVRRQLDAYNAHDIEAFMALWSEDAQYFEHPSKMLASGAAQIRERHVAGFKEAKPVGELISRVVLGNRVVDHERVTCNFPEGRGQLEVVAIYEVGENTVDRAWFLFGNPEFNNDNR